MPDTGDISSIECCALRRGLWPDRMPDAVRECVIWRGGWVIGWQMGVGGERARGVGPATVRCFVFWCLTWESWGGKPTDAENAISVWRAGS